MSSAGISSRRWSELPRRTALRMREDEARARLRAEIAALSQTTLTPAEREEIATRVRSGRIAQAKACYASPARGPVK